MSLTIPSPNSEPIAEPLTVLSTLRSHLLPTPLLSLLPSALQLFAHLQSLRGQLTLESTRILETHAQMVLLTQDSKQENLDCLTRDEIKLVNNVRSRENEEREMESVSIHYRKYHLACLLIADISPDKITPLVNLYFPTTQQAQTIGHLFIRLLKPADLVSLEEHRTQVLYWLTRRKTSRLSFDALIEGTQGEVGDSLGREMLRLSERVLEDCEILKRVISSSPTSTPILTQPEISSGPSHQILRKRSHSPSPDHIARLPRLSFDISRGRPRVSLTPHNTSIHTHSPSMSISLSPSTHRGGPIRTLENPRPVSPTELHSSSSARPSYAAKAMYPGPQDESSRRSGENDGYEKGGSKSRKRPRALMIDTGPDYTAPSPRLGERVSKDQLRPFPSSMLRRSIGKDEGSTRRASPLRRGSVGGRTSSVSDT
ncbi:hypothetical protein TREMEDRAFT_65497 [Tremella mesenterica DSM 1558]|uniref:uncharacterized protein n=1 Tax=Tremella mesenterica (strain ATCC 24925 / CBS 8224 / DSM 1558 / NBRC 9311 / NRRL Y-6157 / RJB 2259-6 / UBC 559-6) TaxID=578456 RepID=UPI00032D47EF|nr:uncharacterized protein TREMEDRAFT_65497 [Tremella mesenterica DSM 1558]EIW66629.1 hypothetical protein TREMEDRAFT_65497 [Tremella mesenterica DSM 1558]